MSEERRAILELSGISKSFGPFLRKRMQEERVYTAIDDVPVAKDKKTRARSIQGVVVVVIRLSPLLAWLFRTTSSRAPARSR